MYVCISKYVCIHVCISKYRNLSIYLSTYTTYICEPMFVNIYIHGYIYIYIYIYKVSKVSDHSRG